MIAAWCVVVFLMTAQLFGDALQLLADTTESWQQRLIRSNIEYVLALFFLLFNLLWQGIAVDAFSKVSSRVFLTLYRAVIFPLLTVISLILLIPLEFNLHERVTPTHWATTILWILIAGDISGLIGKNLGHAEWFQEKIFKVGSTSKLLIFHGMRGRAGVLMLHFAILMFFIAGIFGIG